MANAGFRAEQHARIRDPHVKPINDFIDELRVTHGWTPYVAPLHAGVDARMLSVLRDPGDMTRDDDRGSGMICMENDDQTAEKQAELADAGGILPTEFMPWNSVPWYVGNRKPTTAELHEATPSLVALLDLLPKLEVVLLQGGEAQRAWSYLRLADPRWMRRGLKVIPTLHPSQSALQTPDPDERARRVAHRVSAWKQAGELLHG
jgi:hypothetical protein